MVMNAVQCNTIQHVNFDTNLQLMPHRVWKDRREAGSGNVEVLGLENMRIQGYCNVIALR
jgi:hypothetical protein